MDLRVKLDCSGIDWEAVVGLLRSVGMGSRATEVYARAFAGSQATVFVFDGERLIGVGRAISDGVSHACVYDCAVMPEYQGKGIGSLIVRNILDGVAGCDVTLFAMPGKEGFYRKLGFRWMMTGMARFVREDEMREKGFTD